jgi:23S rRNA (adenine2503-C2)-methyltransferase
MPVNVKYPLAEVIEAAKAFDRRTTFEYVMLGGVNDRPEHARALGPARAASAARSSTSSRCTPAARRLHADPAEVIQRFARAVRARGSRWRCAAAAASTSPRRAGSYGSSASAGGRHVRPTRP